MKIPAQMQPIYEEIAGMIEEYCAKYLNEEYLELCLRWRSCVSSARPRC